MAKTRLRNDDRDAIRSAIIDNKFRPIEAGLAAEANALAIKARARGYGEFVNAMDAAPIGAFPSRSNVIVNVDGKKVSLKTAAAVRCFYEHLYGSEVVLTLKDTDKLGVEIMAYATRAEAVKAEKETLREQVRGTLAAFSTFDDLQREWPEADAFITARWRTRPDYTANVPAIQISALTTALDLPPDVAEAA